MKKQFVFVLVLVVFGVFGYGSMLHAELFTDTGIDMNGSTQPDYGYQASLSWGDYDNDGDLDVLYTAGGENGYHVSKVYRNDGNTFPDINAGLVGVNAGSSAWGDYDNDGDLDILLAGGGDNSVNVPISKIYSPDGHFKIPHLWPPQNPPPVKVAV